MSKQIANFNINGRPYEAIVEPHMLLLDVLRDVFDLTGTKRVCGAGDCGACTVLVDGKPILSCLSLAVSVRNTAIQTVEGLSQDGALHPLQQAFMDSGGVQCGYCTPGILMFAKAYLKEHPNAERQEMREAFAGNLCRCTGYVKILDALVNAADVLREERASS